MFDFKPNYPDDKKRFDENFENIFSKEQWLFLPAPWQECCVVCGGHPEIKTKRDNLDLLYEDDEIRCSECHCQASVIIYNNIACLHWIEETSNIYKDE